MHGKHTTGYSRPPCLSTVRRARWPIARAPLSLLSLVGFLCATGRGLWNVLSGREGGWLQIDARAVCLYRWPGKFSGARHCLGWSSKVRHWSVYVGYGWMGKAVKRITWDAAGSN